MGISYNLENNYRKQSLEDSCRFAEQNGMKVCPSTFYIVTKKYNTKKHKRSVQSWYDVLANMIQYLPTMQFKSAYDNNLLLKWNDDTVLIKQLILKEIQNDKILRMGSINCYVPVPGTSMYVSKQYPESLCIAAIVQLMNQMQSVNLFIDCKVCKIESVYVDQNSKKEEDTVTLGTAVPKSAETLVIKKQNEIAHNRDSRLSMGRSNQHTVDSSAKQNQRSVSSAEPLIKEVSKSALSHEDNCKANTMGCDLSLPSGVQMRNRIKDLNERINKLLQSCKNIGSEKTISKSLLILKNELETIRNYCCDKYDVVFIGKCGAGKTTLICHWLNLLTKEIIGKGRNEITLLKSASGRTTSAEVIIEQTNEPSSIQIVPMSESAVKSVIADVCNNIWRRARENTNIDDDVYQNTTIKPVFHEEDKRLVLNMASLTDSKADDCAKTLSLEGLISLIERKVNLKNRDTLLFRFKGKESFETWLKDTFERLNYGLIENAPIPYRIIVKINLTDLNMKLPSYINRVIDTKGLDSEGARKDLCEYIQSPNTICIILDSIKAVPEDPVCKLLQYSYQGQFSCRQDHLSPNCWCDKLALYVCSEDLDDALASVNQADDDVEKGKSIKINEIRSKIAHCNLVYRIENTKFLDVLAPYEMAKNDKRRKVISSIDNKLVLENCTCVNQSIEAMMQRVNKRLNDEIRHVKNEIDKLSAEIDSLSQKKIAQYVAELRAVKNIILGNRQKWKDRFNVAFCDTIIDDCLKTKHWQTIKAMTRRYGGDHSFYANLYDDIRLISAPRIFTKYADVIYKEIREVINSCKIQENCERMKIFDKHIDELRNKKCDEFGTRLSSLCSDEILYPRNLSNPFWSEANSISGSGYTNRIVGLYSNKFSANSKSFSQCLSRVGSSWIDCVVDLFNEI